MNLELENRILIRWPRWFNTASSPQSAMARGFEHGDGWFRLLWQTFVNLEPVVAGYEQDTGSPFEIVQVKEKFGTLRIRIRGGSEAIWNSLAWLSRSLRTSASYAVDRDDSLAIRGPAVRNMAVSGRMELNLEA